MENEYNDQIHFIIIMKLLYELLISPLGLPINPIWEYLIILLIGEIVHEIAYKVSPGGAFGSLIYWLTKIVAFFVIWAFLYFTIIAIQFIIDNWIICLLIACVLLIGIVFFYKFTMERKKE